MGVKLRVLFFSLFREVTGESELDWELPGETARVSDLLDALFARWPALAPWDGSLLVAVDRQFATRDDELASGQEVAIMPPVQGG